MSRQLLADPDWVNKVAAGEEQQIHRLCALQQEVSRRLAAASGNALHL